MGQYGGAICQPVKNVRTQHFRIIDGVLLFVLGLGLYSLTLAPTVLWGDEGYWQLQAVKCNLQASAGGHPLWVLVAHLFSRIPIGDVAGRVNLVSALFGAIVLFLMFLLLQELGLQRGPAIGATLALMVSHTFWSYSVRAEVYTLTLTVMALLAWLGLRWYHTGRRRYLTGIGFLLGLGLAIHLMIVLYIPGLLFLLWAKRSSLDRKSLLLFVLACVLGVIPLVLLLIRDAQTYGMSWTELIEWALFSFEGYSFKDALLDFSLKYFPSDLFQWVAFLALQFIGLALVGGIVGLIKGRDILDRDEAIYLMCLYTGSAIFAFPYRVGDRYVFYLPSYLPFTAWVACGFQWLKQRCLWPILEKKHYWWVWLIIGVLLVSIPITVYRIGPELVERGITFRDTRHVPGPGGKYFFLLPPKNGYYDPRQYAEAVLEALPEGAILLAEPVLVSPLRFVQIVEGKRPDVTIHYCCWDIQQVLTSVGERPLAVADLDPSIYPVAWLRQNYEIVSQGPVYLLVPKLP